MYSDQGKRVRKLNGDVDNLGLADEEDNVIISQRKGDHGKTIYSIRSVLVQQIAQSQAKLPEADLAHGRLL